MTIGYRPKGESGPAYHPDRDYAYVTPTLMRAAIERLEDSALSEEARAWKKDNDIAEADIIAVSEALARAQRDFINAADPVNSMEQALNRRDFYDVRYPARQFLFAAIGEVFCAAWFKAVREVTRVNEDSPAAAGMAEFAAAVRSFVGANSTTTAANTAVADLQLRNDVLQSRLNTVYSRVQELERQLAANVAANKSSESFSWFSRLFGTNRT
jgi:hypothetical protein